MSAALPEVGGVFIQMEDEIASMAAVIGASLGGSKAMTATSGPGFSLKQENLGYAAATEVPCVIVNVMRGGPSTGLPTRPAQGDVMQARWGTHGDHPIVVLTPHSVSEIHAQTMRAFNLSERLRVPVVVLYDETLGHLTETVDLTHHRVDCLETRPWATTPPEDFRPYVETEDLIPAMARPGDGYRSHTTGLTHGEDGFPTQDPAAVERAVTRLLRKMELHQNEIAAYDVTACDDAEIVLIAYGISARAAQRAVSGGRQSGVRVGLFRPITLWPFPEAAFAAATRNARTIVVPEMNAGQLRLEIERLSRDGVVVRGLNRMDGAPIEPAAILDTIRETALEGGR